MTKPTVGSLFSGVGGFDLGLERAGWEVKWQVENDTYCNTQLERHWPDVKRFGDIQTVSAKDLPPVDLLCGGFPCQDVSVAGRRAGLDGERSSLWIEYLRLVQELGPSWILIENVPGLFSSHKGEDFATVIEGLSQLGYGLAWCTLDSQYFGVPQQRRRVFIVGCLGRPCPPEILFDVESLSGEVEASRGAQPDIAPALRARGDSRSRDGRDIAYAVQAREGRGVSQRDARTNLVASPIGAHHDRKNADQTYVPDIVRPLTTRTGLHHDESQDTYITGAVTGAEAHNGNSNPIAQNYVVQPPHRSEGGGWSAQEYNAVAVPIQDWQQNGGAISALVPQELGVRKLTPLEDERLQGFPDGWTTGSDTRRYMALGNAVTVPVAEWIGRRILEAAMDSDAPA